MFDIYIDNHFKKLLRLMYKSIGYSSYNRENTAHKFLPDDHKSLDYEEGNPPNQWLGV